MSKLYELTIEAHKNIYTGEQREIPMVYSVPDAGINDSTIMLVISYGYGASWKANIFKKLLNKLPDIYNVVVATGYYFGSKYMDTARIELDLSGSEQHESDNFFRTKYVEESKCEFNDMGIMQAMDMVYITMNALKQIGKRSEELRHIIIFGSSHGGYLSYLSNAICPNLFSYILDVSSYTFPYYLHNVRRFIINRPFLKASLGFEYLIERDETVCVDEELLDLKKIYSDFDNTCRIISFHGMKDWMVDYRDKQELFDIIGENGELLVFSEESVDGNFIKNVDHGLGLNFEILFDGIIPMVKETEFERKEIGDGLRQILGEKLILKTEDGFPRIVFCKMKNI